MLDSSSSSCSESKYKLFESKFLKFFENEEPEQIEEEIMHPFLEKNKNIVQEKTSEIGLNSSISQDIYTNQKIDLNLVPKTDNLDKTQPVIQSNLSFEESQ